MKSILALLSLTALIIGSAMATNTPVCTEADIDTWMSETDFITMANSLGYQSDGFTVTDGNCYAITKADGEKGELEYFNPVTGVIVQ